VVDAEAFTAPVTVGREVGGAEPEAEAEVVLELVSTEFRAVVIARVGSAPGPGALPPSYHSAEQRRSLLLELGARHFGFGISLDAEGLGGGGGPSGVRGGVQRVSLPSTTSKMRQKQER
jgi:hypothetical protein